MQVKRIETVLELFIIQKNEFKFVLFSSVQTLSKVPQRASVFNVEAELWISFKLASRHTFIYFFLIDPIFNQHRYTKEKFILNLVVKVGS